MSKKHRQMDHSIRGVHTIAYILGCGLLWATPVDSAAPSGHSLIHRPAGAASSSTQERESPALKPSHKQRRSDTSASSAPNMELTDRAVAVRPHPKRRTRPLATLPPGDTAPRVPSAPHTPPLVGSGTPSAASGASKSSSSSFASTSATVFSAPTSAISPSSRVGGAATSSQATSPSLAAPGGAPEGNSRAATNLFQRADIAKILEQPPPTPPPPTPSGESALLIWSPNTEADVAGYKIYVGTAPGVYNASVQVGNVTSYTISNLSEGQTYYFSLSAYDFSGNESGRSAEASKSIY